MNETRTTGLAGRHPIATSLFGGAMLATVATASLAQQVTYLANANALLGTTVTSGYVVLGANTPGATCSSGDGGIVFPDAVGHCFYRADPTYSVREWGALCDVVSVSSAGTMTATWNPALGTNGALVVPTAVLSPPPTSTGGQFIAISQIGAPTLFGTSTPAASLTRYSTLSNTGTGYSRGDLISFVGTAGSTGTFSQEAAIIVDAVGPSGSITRWHFLWGGLYAAASLPVGDMAQDCLTGQCRSFTTGTGATLTPAWSGWSVLNSQTILNAGTAYSVGSVVTLTATGAVGRLPKLIVEGTTSGAVTAFEWLDYGSLRTLPTSITTLSDQANPTTGLSFSPVAWTQGPFATTIDHTATDPVTMTYTDIFLTDKAPFPGMMTVQSFYYGDDDYTAISNALAAAPASALVIPAGCGTTRQLNLSQVASANNANQGLAGGNVQSSGVYAFANPLTQRGISGGIPVLARVLYGGLASSSSTVTAFSPTSGGGFRDMFVEGFGIPEGYGYYGLAQGTTFSSWYVGPTFTATGTISGTVTNNIPTAGDVVEIDASRQLRIDNVHIADGGIGSGNSAFQCGLDESNPTGSIIGAVASITFTNSRLDANPAFAAGPSNPDFALRLDGGCAGSTFRNLTAYDGTKADILQYAGNALAQIHVDSNVTLANAANGPAGLINWGTNTSFGLAGVADYGVYVVGATALSQTVCGVANLACVLATNNAQGTSANAGQITDTQMRCGNFTNVPSGYFGVELASGALNTTVSGTASAGKCAIPPLQLIVLDDPTNPATASLSLCNNSNAPVAGCTGYQGPFATGQFYTQPAVSYGTVSVSGNVLYAVPFFSPASGGPISKLGIDVATGSATCRVGIYSALNAQPNTLIVDAGTLSGAAGTLVTTGSLTPSVALAPQTLYFLAVGCSGTASLVGAVNNVGALSGPLTGTSNYAGPTTQITAAWTFSSGALPTIFGGGTITSAPGAIPNVYAGP